MHIWRLITAQRHERELSHSIYIEIIEALLILCLETGPHGMTVEPWLGSRGTRNRTSCSITWWVSHVWSRESYKTQDI